MTFPHSTSMINGDAAMVAMNLRRHMARAGLTFDDVVAATELDERTLRSLIRGATNPHARTLNKLATGLGIEIDDLFQPNGRYSARQFDQTTNSLVKGVIADHAELFANWLEADFDELFSRFGTGGQLTEAGVLTAAQAMNAKRDVCRQVSIILESGEADLLSQFVHMLYGRVTVASPPTNGQPRSGDIT
jgi:transcriptional regulator with XRE-family HTH domain